MKLIQVSVNNELKQIDEPQTLAELLPAWGFACEKVAVAVNENFVPRSQYDSYQLADSDRVDVVAPVQGG